SIHRGIVNTAARLCAEQIARCGYPQRARWKQKSLRIWSVLAGGGRRFFLFGFFLLFFFLQLVADHLEDGHLGSVADPDARVDDSRITAGAVRKRRRNLAEP